MEGLPSVEPFPFNPSLQHPCHLGLQVIQIIVFLLSYYLLVFEIDLVFEASFVETVQWVILWMQQKVAH